MLDEFDISEDELDIGIVEDDVAAMEGLKGILKDLGCHVVWAVKNDVEARKAIQEYVPRSVIVDLSLYVERPHSYKEGWDLIKDLRSDYPTLGIIIFSKAPVQDEIVFEAVRLHCSYLIKEDLFGFFRQAIAGALLVTISNDSVVLSQEVWKSVDRIVAEKKRYDLLTNRELEVLALIAEGHTNEEIASQLVTSISTVKTHVSHILDKLGEEVDNRGRAAEWYRQNYPN